MQTTQGSLVLIGLNTPTLQAFWNGHPVQGLIGVGVDWENDEHRVKLHINGTDDALYTELVTAGITVKKVNL